MKIQAQIQAIKGNVLKQIPTFILPECLGIISFDNAANIIADIFSDYEKISGTLLDLDIDQIKDFGIENKKPVKKENILSSFQAYHNCVKSDNFTWQEIHENRIIDILKEKLPHGSGINGKWQFDIAEKHIVCKNFYHRMNQNGYYCGYINFTVKITGNYRDINGKLDFTITGNFGKNQDIKDYLYETINYCLENL